MAKIRATILYTTAPRPKVADNIEYLCFWAPMLNTGRASGFSNNHIVIMRKRLEAVQRQDEGLLRTIARKELSFFVGGRPFL